MTFIAAIAIAVISTEDDVLHRCPASAHCQCWLRRRGRCLNHFNVDFVVDGVRLPLQPVIELAERLRLSDRLAVDVTNDGDDCDGDGVGYGAGEMRLHWLIVTGAEIDGCYLSSAVMLTVITKATIAIACAIAELQTIVFFMLLPLQRR